MSNTSRIEAAPLLGRHVRLEPLNLEHHAALCEAGNDPGTFRYFPMRVAGSDPMREFVEFALREQAGGRALPFVIRTLHDHRIVGSTRFGAIEAAHARAEIGWTWLTPDVRRTPVNTECKFLLLRHGFEALGYNRIEFKTDSLNTVSRAALLRIGATEEGSFRNHMVMPDGGSDTVPECNEAGAGAAATAASRTHLLTARHRVGGRLRHSVYFSVIREEWPAVRARLEQQLARPHSFKIPAKA